MALTLPDVFVSASSGVFSQEFTPSCERAAAEADGGAPSIPHKHKPPTMRGTQRRPNVLRQAPKSRG